MKTVAKQLAIMEARAIRLRAANKIMREALKDSERRHRQVLKDARAAIVPSRKP